MTTRRQQGVLWEQDGFRVTVGGLRVTGQPSLAEWGQAVRALTRAKSSVQWGVGDLMVYAEARQWEDAAVEEIMDATGLKRGTLLNLRSVAKTFPVERRRTNLPWSHHALVASLHGDEAARLLDVAEEQSFGWEELREHAKAVRRRRQRGEQVFPAGTFGLLLAQPPWRSGGRNVQHPMDADQIAALSPRVQAVTAPSAVLYLHATNVQLEDALMVLKAWGFTLRGHHVIVSQIPEHTTEFMRERHELLLVGTRGKPLGPTNVPDSVLHAETEAVVEILERSYIGVPSLLLFAEQAREGWTTWDHSVRVVEPPTRGILVRAEEPEAEDVPA